jgi:tRNA-Thr(GGU) m(6)t(6)A37 methyltransferase TsaA
MQEIPYGTIGVVRSPFHEVEGMPLQSVAAADAEGRVELEPAFADGLADVEGFSHLWLLTHLHRAVPAGLRVVPFLDDRPRGVFATRSPRHPNPIGLSLVELLAVRGSTLHVRGIDVLDGTPVLDLKPYVPLFDVRPDARAGWFEERGALVFERRAPRSESDPPPPAST